VGKSGTESNPEGSLFVANFWAESGEGFKKTIWGGQTRREECEKGIKGEGDIRLGERELIRE